MTAALLALLTLSACAQTVRTADTSVAMAGCPRAPLPSPSGPGVGGPAVTSLTGGAARSGFSLDGGALTVRPPDAGDRPAVTAATATCDALAVGDLYGFAYLEDARTSGLAYGYGRVGVRPAGAAAPYRSRLAWIVVTRHGPPVAPCPPSAGGGADQPTPPPPTTPNYEYDVFLLDAHTGGNALSYTEGGDSVCGGPPEGPHVSVPTDRVSVPWRLISRNANGFSATIAAQVLPCDQIDRRAEPDENTPALVRVVVARPIGPACGAGADKRLTLDAATVNSNLPATLEHAPTGLMLTDPATQSDGGGTVAQGPLRDVDYTDCGKTITIGVATVLVLPPIPEITDDGWYPVVSSDPSVVGPLDDLPTGSMAEIRAWKAGRTDLRIGPIPAEQRPMFGRCARSWVLHIVVR